MTFGELKPGQQFFFEHFFAGAVCVKVEQQLVFPDSGTYRLASAKLDDVRLSKHDVQVRPA
jgi:hypothetical protein